MPPADPPSLREPFATVLSLYDEGRCVSAWNAGRAVAPLEEWPPVEAALLASRLTNHLGAPRRSSVMQLRMFRAHPKHALAQYYYLYRVGERRGALAAWRERSRLGAPPDHEPQALAEYHGQCAMLLAALRDFERAEEHLARARDAHPRPYWYVERSAVCYSEDRYAESLKALEEGLSRHPRYPPLVIGTAGALVILDRDAEAMELLRSRLRDSEVSGYASFLLPLLMKRGLLDEAEDTIRRYDELTPLKERAATDLLENARAEVATRRGDYAAAVRHVEQVSHKFHKDIASNLRAFLERPHASPPRRVELPVAFVRQHHLTCAPATLTAVSRFWRRPAEHLAVAEEICYDGTPLHSERRWAEENGWATREFRVDWESAVALIDRGIPFTLALADIVVGHLQAVVGYDEPTGMFYVRDPYSPFALEMNARRMFEAQRALGPRGLALVPRDRAHLLDGLRFPDAEMYDRYHRLQLALEAHDRDRALERYREMAAADARHRLTLSARLSVASYDGNPHEELAATDELLALFPDDNRLTLFRLRLMRQLTGRDERLAWINTICERKGADPVFWLERAAELEADRRELPAAVSDVRRALRLRRDFPPGVFRLASLVRQMGHDDEALELSRLAACLDDRNEACAYGYFTACRLARRSEVAVDFLRDRIDRLGDRSSAPARTLIHVLNDLGRAEEGFRVLDEAVARRPDDGELRLFAASVCARYGREAAARAHRAAAEGRVKRTAWLASMAREAHGRGEREQALALWREVLRLQPLDMDAHGMIAVLLSETGGRSDAVAELRAACDRFPHHLPLRRMLYPFTHGDPAADREPLLREILRLDSANAWAMRELALNLRHQSRVAEALEIIDAAIARDPDDAEGYLVKGRLLYAAGDLLGAAACYRSAIARSADNEDAIRGLLATAGDSADRRKELLEFVESELLRQPVLGDGLLAFRTAARGVLTSDELLAALRRAHEQRPDLWQAWSALGRHLSEMGRTDEALDVAGRAAAQFAMVPRMWLDLSHVHRDRRDRAKQIEALERCREIGPEWAAPIFELVEAWEETGRRDDAVRLLESAIARTPVDPVLRGRLAALQHQSGDRDRALETIREAIRLSPDYAWAWTVYARWSAEQGDPSAALDLARAAAESRPGEARPWFRLAQLLIEAGRAVDGLHAAELALAIDPRYPEAHDMRAVALMELNRFDEAIAACRPPVYGHRVPHILRGREAWIVMKRGEADTAITMMAAVVDEVPDYLWGWGCLMEWHAERQAYEPALRAAERMYWLDPSQISTLGWMGELKERLNDAKGAREIYERAMWLQPSYQFAGVRNFHLQRLAGDLRGAGRTIEILRPFASHALILSLQVDLAIMREDSDWAMALLRELCIDPANDAATVERSAKAILQRGWSREMEEALRDALDHSEWHPSAAAMWAKARTAHGGLASGSDIRALTWLDDPAKGAIYVLIDAIGGRGSKVKGVAKIRLWWNLRTIRSLWRVRGRDDVLYWAKIGYALVSLERFRDAIEWLDDWKSRRGVTPEMLHNLVVAYLSTGMVHSARDVLQQVGRPIADGATCKLYLRLACVMNACLDDELDLAHRLLANAKVAPADKRYEALRDYCVAIVDILRSAPGPEAMTHSRRKVIQTARGQVSSSTLWRLLRPLEQRLAKHTATELPPPVSKMREVPARVAAIGEAAIGFKILWWFLMVGLALYLLSTS